MRRAGLAAAAAALLAACSDDAFQLFDPAAPVMNAVYTLETIDGGAPPATFPDTANPGAATILTGDTLVFASDGQVMRRRATIFVFPVPGGLDSSSGVLVSTGAYEMAGSRVVLWIQDRAPVALPDTLDAVGTDGLETDDSRFGARLRYRRTP